MHGHLCDMQNNLLARSYCEKYAKPIPISCVNRYTDPDDDTMPEDIYQNNTLFLSPLYIILIQGTVTRTIAFILLHIMNRGAMGKSSVCLCKKKQTKNKNKKDVRVTPQ